MVIQYDTNFHDRDLYSRTSTEMSQGQHQVMKLEATAREGDHDLQWLGQLLKGAKNSDLLEQLNILTYQYQVQINCSYEHWSQ